MDLFVPTQKNSISQSSSNKQEANIWELFNLGKGHTHFSSIKERNGYLSSVSRLNVCSSNNVKLIVQKQKTLIFCLNIHMGTFHTTRVFILNMGIFLQREGLCARIHRLQGVLQIRALASAFTVRQSMSPRPLLLSFPTCVHKAAPVTSFSMIFIENILVWVPASDSGFFEMLSLGAHSLETCGEGGGK